MRRLEAQGNLVTTNLKYASSESEPSNSSSSLSRISPLILLIIIIIAVMFFIYGFIHLILWFLFKRPSPSSSLYATSSNNRFSDSTQRTRVLEQLFQLHDSGLDQSLIDALPIFCYKDLLGLKEPFDCAVCLCEFSDLDTLRLLPDCSHAFHVVCLDTWLLSNSTCPLCRATLNIHNCLGCGRMARDEEEGVITAAREQQVDGKRVFSVRLGKLSRNNGIEAEEEEEYGTGTSTNTSLDVGRRCYSMGSYQYEVRDSNLQVLFSQSRADDLFGGKRIIANTRKGESFSVSKIWLWSNKTKFHSFNSFI